VKAANCSRSLHFHPAASDDHKPGWEVLGEHTATLWLRSEVRCQSAERACTTYRSAASTLALHYVLNCPYVIQNLKLPRKATEDVGAGSQVHKVQASKTSNYILSAALQIYLLPTKLPKGKTVDIKVTECL